MNPIPNFELRPVTEGELFEIMRHYAEVVATCNLPEVAQAAKDWLAHAQGAQDAVRMAENGRA